MKARSFLLFAAAAVLFAGCGPKGAGKKPAAAAMPPGFENPTEDELEYAESAGYAPAADTQKAAALISAADGKLKAGNAAGAKADYLTAFDMLEAEDARRVHVSERLGVIFMKGGKAPAAKKLFAQAVTTAEKYKHSGKAVSDAYNGLGICLEKEGNIKAAIPVFEKAAAKATDKVRKAKIRKHIADLKSRKKKPGKK